MLEFYLANNKSNQIFKNLTLLYLHNKCCYYQLYYTCIDIYIGIVLTNMY